MIAFKEIVRTVVWKTFVLLRSHGNNIRSIFNFVKQAPCEFLTWIFSGYLLIKKAVHEFECKSCIHGYHIII